MPESDAAALARRLERERRARREAETVAEDTLRELYETVRDLQRSKAVLDETTDFVVIADLGGRARYVNRALLELLGLESADALELNILDLLTESSRQRFQSEALPRLEDKGVWRGELAMLSPRSGAEIPVSQVLIGHRRPDGALDSLSAVSRDITDRLAMEERLTHMALHDPLTGLPNRRLFFDRLDVALARSARAQTPVGLFYLDLDGFKAVNDAHGHEVGDDLLIAVAQRLLAGVRPSDTVCRLGGDEFCILCEHVGDAAGALAVAGRIGERLAAPVVIDEIELTMTASIGVLVTDRTPDDPEELLHMADTAMYEAKRTGKAHARLYDPAGH